MPDTAFLAVVVAAVSVVASVILQLRTLQVTKESNHETLRVTAGVANLQHAIDGLTDDLSQYMANSYFIDSGYHDAMRNDRPWPGEYRDNVKQEDLLYAKIRLRLNPADVLDAKLLAALDALRSTDSKELWITRRDRVVAITQAVFASKWKTLLELEPSHSRLVD